VQQLIVATRNAHKTREIQEILGPKFEVRGLSEDDMVAEIYESGKSFEENAKIKAITVSRQLQGLVIADDSGLEVEALGGAPGIYSARYGGESTANKEKIARVLDALARISAKGDRRKARFRSVLALARDGKILGTFEGIVKGRIADCPRGACGFGYDPIFVPDGFERTFGELSPELKNSISHRGQAVRALVAKLAALQAAN
jgi:XTP/dITP diphosphohydrolase